MKKKVAQNSPHPIKLAVLICPRSHSNAAIKIISFLLRHCDHGKGIFLEISFFLLCQGVFLADHSNDYRTWSRERTGPGEQGHVVMPTAPWPRGPGLGDLMDRPRSEGLLP